MGYVLITGGNLKNKGAQSMIFIAVDEVRKRYPDKDIVVLSDPDATRPASEISQFAFAFRDHTCLYGSKYKLIQRRYGKLDRTRDAKLISKNVDMVIDISGYTFGTNWGWMANLLAAYRSRRAKKLGAKIYYMPQSFGPFEFRSVMDKITKKLMKKWLSYAEVLYAREQEGVELLEKHFGFHNVKLSADLVLQNTGVELTNVYRRVPEHHLPLVQAGSVGILPNVRNYKYGNTEKLIALYGAMIRELLKENKKVYLIRHATEDLDFCRKIKAEFAKEESVVLLENDLTCTEYGKLVQDFDFLIASRYHAIVHAYKEKVPCLVLGWAVKYRELLQKFGQEEYAFDVRGEIDDQKVLAAMKKMMNNREQEVQKLRDGLFKVQQDNVFDCIGEGAAKGTDENARKTVSAIADERLCTGCGSCAAVCPVSCIAYEKKEGYYLPVVNKENCISCGKCLKVCPQSERETDALTYEGLSGKRPLQTLVMQTKKAEILENATSGGVITSLVKGLLESDRADCAFLARGYAYEEQLESIMIRKGDDLSETQKSRYIPVSQKNAVKYILEHPDRRVIFVGTGCAVSGLLKALKAVGLGRENVFIIGLFCDRTMTYSVYDYMKAGYATESALKAFHFRDKKAGGWPGNMRLEFEDGRELCISAKERMIVKDFFTARGCLSCHDKLNVQADIAVGDNYTGENASGKGSSSVLIWTKAGLEAFEQTKELFEIWESDYEKVLSSQHIKKRLDKAQRVDLAGLTELKYGERGDTTEINRRKKKKKRELYRNGLLARVGLR